MDSSNISLAAWSYGLAGFAYTAFSFYLLHLGRNRKFSGMRARLMLGAGSASAVWGWIGLAYGLTEIPWFLLAGLVADVLRYGSWFAFLIALIRPGDQKVADDTAVLSWLPRVAVALVLAGFVILGLLAFGINVVGDASRLVLFHSLAMIVMALVLVEQLFRNVASDSRWNVKPLCLGLAGAFVFDLYLYSEAVLFNRLDADASNVRGVVHALIVPLLVLSTVRSRDWVSKIRLSQRAAFHSATLLIAGIYLLFMAAVGYFVRYFGGEWGRALQLALIFTASMVLLVLVFSGTMRAKLRVQLGKHFFSYRFDYREEWLRFTHTLSAQESPQAMGQQVIRGLADMLESPAGSLWLRDPSQGFFSQTAIWNMPAVSMREEAGSSFCSFLRTSGWVINLEEYRCFQRRYEQLDLPDWLLDMPSAWLIVPLMVGNELIGFVILASARTYVEVNWEVNDLLKTAGRQAASFLAQMQATEALLEARKFDAFNRMSAFVVHDLKNIVTQLSLMLRNAERHRNNPEFQQDMLMTVENSVERMRQLMLQLREGATPPGTPCGVDLADMIERIRVAKAGQGRMVDVQILERLVTRGHEERIERVIGHVVQNALDATDSDGRVCVKLDRQGGQARIEVEDTGHGMSAEFIRERLFKPFQTTKQAGMGIGAYESFQYVQELGGKILVDSELNKGTRVTMLLPLFNVDNRSDLRQREVA